jgi:hypothetical protein
MFILSQLAIGNLWMIKGLWNSVPEHQYPLFMQISKKEGENSLVFRLFFVLNSVKAQNISGNAYSVDVNASSAPIHCTNACGKPLMRFMVW